MSDSTSVTAEPRFAGVRNDLIRALPESSDSLELRATAEGEGTTMFGHFAKFNSWTEINSMWEGRFLERIAPGAFTKTFSENRAQIRVLTEHGHDPTIGKRALGTIDVLREDENGGYYEVSLVDAADVRDLIMPRLKANLYGASFRFQVVREDVIEDASESDYNPGGLPERTIKECRLYEFGPVTFPAYADATAGMRSMTDEFVPAARMAAERDVLMARLEADPELRTAIFGRIDEWRSSDGGGTVINNKNITTKATPEPSKATTSLYGQNGQKEQWRL